MKQKIFALMVLTVLSIPLLLVFVPMASAEVNYTTDFDDLTGWTLGADYKAELSSAQYVSSPTSFLVSANGEDQLNYGYKGVAGINPVFKFEIQVRPYPATANQLYVGFDASEPMYVRFIYAGPTTYKIYHFDGSDNRAGNASAVFNTSTWYNLTTVVDLDGDTIKTYMDGDLIVDESVSLSDTPPSVFWVHGWVPIGGNIPCTIYVDDLTVTSYDDPPTYSGVSYSSVFAGTINNLGVTVDDDVALEGGGGYIFSTNTTGPWTNASWTAFSSTPQTLSVQITNNETAGTVVGFQFFFNDSGGNWNYSTITAFTLLEPLEPEEYIPPIGDEYEQVTYYFNNYAFAINNVTGYALTEETPEEDTTQEISTAGSANISWGARVWVLYNGSTDELTDGTPVVIGTLTGENETMLSEDLNVSETALVFGYGALQVNLYSRWDAGSWTVRTVFVSDYLYYTRIMDSNGFIQLYVNRTESGGNTYSTAYWGLSSFSGVGDLTFRSPRGYDWQAYYLNRGNLVSFLTIPYVAVLGNGFYAFVLFGIGMSVYIRYRQFSMVALFIVLLSGGGSVVGGVINLVVGEVFIGAVWLCVAFGIALVYWRVFR